MPGSPLTLVLLLGLLPYSLPADPVLTPATITDQYGNFADANSTLRWAGLPPGKPYSSGSTYNDGGLGPLFNLAKSFINTCMPGSFPYDMLLGLIQGTYDISSRYMEIVKLGAGFAVCVVIGFLYIFIMPLVGCCICCCRCCCGKCGGDKKRLNKDTDNKYRIIFSIALLVCGLFTMVGAVCVYVTNGQVPVSIDGLGSAISNNVDDLQLFLENTVMELNYVAVNNYNFTATVVERDLDNIGFHVGIKTRDKLGAAGGINSAMDTLLALDNNITVVGAQIQGLDASITNIKSLASTLQTALANAKSSVNSAKSDCSGVTACDNLDTTVLAMDVNFNNLPDMSSQLSKANTVLGNNLTAMVLTGRADYDNIPWKVQTETQSVVTSIKDLLSSFSATIDSTLVTISSLPGQIGGQLSPIKTELEKYRALIAPYDQYRFIAGTVLAGFIVIVVLLQFIGVGLGFLGYNKKRDAHERSQASDSAGRCLLASAGFVFLFTWLLMLLTVVLFLVGALMEKFLCQPLADPEYTIFKKLFDTPGSGIFPGNDYFLAQTILQNGSIPLTVSGVLEGCRLNGAAISVLKLDSMFDLSMVTNYKQSIDIGSEVDQINIDLSNIKLLDASTEQNLHDFSSAVQLDYAGFEAELSKNTAKTDLGVYAGQLRSIAGTAGLPNSAKTKFNNAANDIDAINSGSYTSVNNAKLQMSSDVASLKSATQNTPTGVNATIDAMKATETYMANNATAVIKTMALQYGDHILGIVDSFATETLSKVFNEVGGCLPVYNLYYSIFIVGLCKYVVDVLNGFWVSLGWAILFETIGVIFAIKLAKFLLRMREHGDGEILSETIQMQAWEKSTDSFNKVSPLDDR